MLADQEPAAALPRLRCHLVDDKFLHSSFQYPTTHDPGIYKCSIFIESFQDDHANQPVVSETILQLKRECDELVRVSNTVNDGLGVANGAQVELIRALRKLRHARNGEVVECL